jgi:hypothetical protein
MIWLDVVTELWPSLWMYDVRHGSNEVLENWDHGVDSCLEHECLITMFFFCSECLILYSRSKIACASKDVRNSYIYGYCRS